MLGARGDLEGGRAHGDSSRPRFKEDGKQKMEKEGRKERKEEGGRGDVVSEWANLGAMSDEKWGHFIFKISHSPEWFVHNIEGCTATNDCLRRGQP